MSITRTFFPIGQGAFYSERIETGNNQSFLIVYDCGSEKRLRTRTERQIISTFPKGTVIDILFISHFHADHINGIQALKSTCRIKTVIMPLLKPEDKEIIRIYHRINPGCATIINNLLDNPARFFSSEENETKIIFVAPEDPEHPHEGLGEIIPLGKQRDSISTIPSFSRLTIQGLFQDEWVYIPYNYHSDIRIKQFQEALEQQGITMDMIQRQFVVLKDRIIKAYNAVDGDLNSNSLIIYSGPKNPDQDRHWICQYHQIGNCGNCRAEFIRHFCRYRYPDFLCDNRPGCLYLGDANLNDPGIIQDITTRLNKHIQSLGLVQIPHHGSKENYSPDIQRFGAQYYIISYGTNNSYGHPSFYCLQNLQQHAATVFLVNEKPFSLLTQILD